MKFITYSLSQQEEIQNRADGNEHHQRQHEILLDASCLDGPQFAAKPVRDIGGTVTEKAIDDRQIKVITDERTQPVGGGTEDVQDAVDHALVQEPVNDVLCEPVGWFDKHTIIEFIKVIFILKQRDLQSVFR